VLELLNLLRCILLDLFRSRSSLEGEVIALRHQLNVLRRRAPKRPVLTSFDRFIFVLLNRLAPSKSRRHVVGRAPHTISSVIGTGSTERHLRAASERWAFATDRQRRDRHGRTANAERFIGSIRRECLDHVIVFGEQHLRRVLRSYQQYYNGTRTHLSLGKDSPVPRAVHATGSILPLPILGGLHHHYVRI
jgi:hypothetical protein